MSAKRSRRRADRSRSGARKRPGSTHSHPDPRGATTDRELTPAPLGVFDAVKVAFDRWRAPEERTIRRSIPVVAATVVLGAGCLLGAQLASSSAEVVREGGREVARLSGLRLVLFVLALSAFESTHHIGEAYLSGVFSRSREQAQSGVRHAHQWTHKSASRLLAVALFVGAASGGFYRLGLIGLVLSVFVTSALWVAVPVWSAEGVPLGASLRRSWRLFRRRVWFVVGSALVVMLVRTTTEAVAFGALAGYMREVDVSTWTVASATMLATAAVRLLVVPFGAWVRVVAHSDLAWAEYYASTGRGPGEQRLPEELGRHLPPSSVRSNQRTS